MTKRLWHGLFAPAIIVACCIVPPAGALTVVSFTSAPFQADSEAPEITLLGEATVTLVCDDDYVDAGATAWDACDGDLTDAIVVVNHVNTSVPGNYTVDYTVRDLSGNETLRERSVHVEEHSLSEGEPEGEPEPDPEGEVPAVGSLRVVIGPADAVAAGARWRRSGTDRWHENEATETDVPTGSYSVEFLALDGWETPAPQTVMVRAGERTTITATYLSSSDGEVSDPEGEPAGEGEPEGENDESGGDETTGSLRVFIQPHDAAQAGGQWRRVGTETWRNDDAIETGLSPGEHDVEFKVISNWDTPGNQPAAIQAGRQTTIFGRYEPSVRGCGVSTCERRDVKTLRDAFGDWLLMGATMLALSFFTAKRTT